MDVVLVDVLVVDDVLDVEVLVLDVVDDDNGSDVVVDSSTVVLVLVLDVLDVLEVLVVVVVGTGSGGAATQPLEKAAMR